MFITKNDTLFAEMLDAAVNKGNEEAGEMCKVALQAFVNAPKKAAKAKRIAAMQKRLQAVGVSTDIDVNTTDMFNVTVEEDNFDMGWEAAFRQVNLDPFRDFWEIIS